MGYSDWINPERVKNTIFVIWTFSFFTRPFRCDSNGSHGNNTAMATLHSRPTKIRSKTKTLNFYYIQWMTLVYRGNSEQQQFASMLIFAGHLSFQLHLLLLLLPLQHWAQWCCAIELFTLIYSNTNCDSVIVHIIANSKRKDALFVLV